MNAGIAMLEEALAETRAYEQLWLTHDRRGRWVVMEPGVGRLLPDASPEMRRFVDQITPRRARRFSSLSRARRFANRVGSRVQRWRRVPPNGGVWQRVDPWRWATRHAGLNYGLVLLPSETP